MMQKNLFQKTVYEVYKNREPLGYKVVDAPQMFITLWNDQTISGLSVAHCEQFAAAELEFIKKELKCPDIRVASNLAANINCPELKFDEIAQAMLFECSHMLDENALFEIKTVNNEQELATFCNIVGDVFGMNDNIDALKQSLLPDLKLHNGNKYVGYIDGCPAGIMGISRGSEAALISWVGVKSEFRRQGLCHAMLARAINNEIAKGCYKFVLVATEMGQKVYSKFGFKTIAQRYDYTLNLL